MKLTKEERVNCLMRMECVSKDAANILSKLRHSIEFYGLKQRREDPVRTDLSYQDYDDVGIDREIYVRTKEAANKLDGLLYDLEDYIKDVEFLHQLNDTANKHEANEPK